MPKVLRRFDFRCEVEGHVALNQARVSDSNLIEGYEIVARIESDSPIEVFRATHQDSNKSVLIRFIRTYDSKTELRKELQSYTKISHQNLSRIFECGESKIIQFTLLARI